MPHERVVVGSCSIMEAGKSRRLAGEVTWANSHSPGVAVWCAQGTCGNSAPRMPAEAPLGYQRACWVGKSPSEAGVFSWGCSGYSESLAGVSS